MDNDIKEKIIWIFCTSVVIFLFFWVTYPTQEYDCNKCTVTLKNEIPGSDFVYEFGVFNITELFEEYYKNNTCIVTWSPSQGYTHNG